MSSLSLQSMLCVLLDQALLAIFLSRCCHATCYRCLISFTSCTCSVLSTQHAATLLITPELLTVAALLAVLSTRCCCDHMGSAWWMCLCTNPSQPGDLQSGRGPKWPQSSRSKSRQRSLDLFTCHINHPGLVITDRNY